MGENTTNIDEMSFEQALAELEQIVSTLESGKAPLEDSIHSYERGIALKKHCESKLSAAQEKIEKITITPEGTPKTEPFQE
ncbi:MAG: exodeoxyribonuclease VII small subunit [Alphaproteobacteria bacterium]|nr:exodeoxyribonuclease VII small subunit [Alphaproteobacteria bacterium]